MKINFPLLALAIGAFGIGTTEFSPMGLLPVIAQGVDVSIPAAGMLISAYAIGVMVGAPLMTLLLSHRGRRNALVFLMAIFTLGNVLSALSPDYTTLMLSRIITRRMSFLATAGLGIIAMVSLYFSLPKGRAGERPDVRKELAVLMRPQVVSALLTTVLGAGAMFTLYTYISPVLHRITDATPAFITAMLVLVGVGFSIGNYLGGKLADRSVTATLKGFLLLLIVIMAAIPWLARSEIGAAISMVIWGAATFAVVPPLQMRVMRVAHEAPGLSSSVNIGAFNLGNALGAAAGGAVISGGLGYTVVPITGAIIAGMALLLVLLSGRTNAERTCTAAE